MGWFWADAPQFAAAVAPHPVSSPSATPPPACPAHKPEQSSSAPFPPRLDSPSEVPSSCPVNAPNHPLRNLSSSSPNQPTASLPSPPQSQSPPSTTTSTLSKYNPLNYIPAGLTNVRPADSPQSVSLPLERELSTIPRGDIEANWEYPSPQQMYNAMLRKGYTDTPADAVESMVAVHNFLNEGAWHEIVEWESIFSQGLSRAWDQCRRGEQGLAMDRARREFQKARREARGLKEPIQSKSPTDGAVVVQPKLLRFQGRPNEPTPKARMLGLLGMAFPEKFGSEPPFDRHDWFVTRRTADGQSREVRYVIDYYSGGVEPTGEPVFYLDIRPAIDSPTAAAERLMRWGGDFWWRASGGIAREIEAANRAKKAASS